MSFGDLNASYSDLRDALRAHVAVEALDDLNIRPPSGDVDEASFLRLTAWCFSLLFEAGRYSIPFLLDLNVGGALQSSQQHKNTRQNVQRLRSFVSHNLGFDDRHDMAVRKQVSDWFVETCGSALPASKEDWAKCFSRLSRDVREVVRHCSATLSSVLSTPEDRDLIIEDLRRRLKRILKPHEFDQIVEDSAARLGERINSRAFRDTHIGSWQRYLATLPDDADPKPELERLIDGQVADHFRSQLPVRAQEIMDAFELEPGPEVGQAIEIVRRLFGTGVRDKADLLAKARVEFENSKSSASENIP